MFYTPSSSLCTEPKILDRKAQKDGVSVDFIVSIEFYSSFPVCRFCSMYNNI